MYIYILSLLDFIPYECNFKSNRDTEIILSLCPLKNSRFAAACEINQFTLNTFQKFHERKLTFNKLLKQHSI